MNLAPRGRLARLLDPRGPVRYLLSLAEQGFSSVLNLGLNLWLIREVGAAEYGLFVFWMNVSLMVSSVQNALTICHLLALPPGAEHREARREPERLLLTVSLVMIAVTALVSLLTVVLGDTHKKMVPGAVAGFLPALLIYYYARALAFSRGAVLGALLLTFSVLLLGAGLFAGFYLAGIRPDAGYSLLILALAYGVSGIVGLLRLSPGVRPSFRLSALRPYLHYVADSRWVLLGVIATELLTRFYSFIVIAWFGTAALGALSAAQVLLRPAVLAVTSWGWVARADMAGRREAQDWRGFLISLGRGLAGTLLISLPWAFCVYFAWPLVSAHLYRGRYSDAGWIALLWGFSAALAGLLSAFSIAFQALRAFRNLAMADLAGSVVSVLATLALLSRFAYPMSIVGMMVGQAAEIGILVVMLTRLVPFRPGQSRLLATGEP